MEATRIWHDSYSDVLEFGIVLERLGEFESTRQMLEYFSEPWAFEDIHELWVTFGKPTDPALDRHGWQALESAHSRGIAAKRCDQCGELARFFVVDGGRVTYRCAAHCPREATEWVDAIDNPKIPLEVREQIEDS